MRDLLYMIGAILLIGWIVGAFVIVVGKIIHIMLLFALLFILMGWLKRDSKDAS